MSFASRPTFLLSITLATLSISSVAQTADTARVKNENTSEQIPIRISVEEILASKPMNASEEQSSVASQIELPIRKTPAVISVLTETDIQQSGARDLMELLSFLPGFNFAHDLNNVVGIGVRGLWSLEGKVLVLIDDQVLNETSFGSVDFMGHVFLDNISRIEIIRGPGSAIYGGMAGLAVIKITTKDSKDFQGFAISQSLGHSQGKQSRYVVQSGIGKIFNNGLGLSASGYMANTNISNQELSTKAGLVNFADSSAIKASQFNLKASYKKLQLVYLFDNHRSEWVEGAGGTFNKTHSGSIKYSFPISSKLEIQPQLNIKIHRPWNYYGLPDESVANYNTLNDRYSANVKLVWNPKEQINIISGVEYYQEHLRLKRGAAPITFNNGSDNGLSDFIFYAQGIYTSKWVNLTTGLRMENHSVFGLSLVPRIGLTQAWEHFNFKLLWSNAFKAPTFQNIIVNQDILPERFSVSEAEIGYQLTENLSFSTNLFLINVKRPIVFIAIDDINGRYENLNRTGSRGFELAAHIKQKWGSLKANYSYYAPWKDEIDYYHVQSEDGHKAFLGFPSHKVVVNGNFNLNGKYSLNFSSVVQSDKHALNTDDNGDPVPQNVSPNWQVNIQFTANRFLVDDLHLTAGIYNLLNSNSWMVQPYRGEDIPMPQLKRELVIKLSYRFHGN
jgi:outer membrane cobalamin receptor